MHGLGNLKELSQTLLFSAVHLYITSDNTHSKVKKLSTDGKKEANPTLFVL